MQPISVLDICEVNRNYITHKLSVLKTIPPHLILLAMQRTTAKQYTPIPTLQIDYTDIPTHTKCDGD